MEKNKAKQKASFSKKKAGPALGYRTSDFFKASKFSGYQAKQMGKFNTSQFKTQHKGGS